MRENKWGYINGNGEIIIRTRFEMAYGFGESGLAYVKNEDQWALVSANGTLVFKFPKAYSPAIHHVDSGTSELSIVVNDEYKYGLIDHEGKILLPSRYEQIGKFNDFGLATVVLKGKIGLIDKTGMPVLQPNLSEISEFYDDGYARVGLEEIAGFYSVGIINSQGQYISKYTFKK